MYVLIHLNYKKIVELLKIHNYKMNFLLKAGFSGDGYYFFLYLRPTFKYAKSWIIFLISDFKCFKTYIQGVFGVTRIG